MNQADIVIHETLIRLPSGVRDVYTFEWEGDVGGVASINCLSLEQTGGIKALPWPVEILEYDPFYDRYKLCRLDAFPFYALNRAMADYWRAYNAVKQIEYRLIWTFILWGVGKPRQGEPPSWDWLFG